VTVVITSLLSLKVSNIIRFANAPVPGFKATDTLTSVALVLTFERRSR
jgi:putative salt-induced outer membrane protein YdiY